MNTKQTRNELKGFVKKLGVRKTVLLAYLLALLLTFIYVPQCIYSEGHKISYPYTFIWSFRSPVAQVDFSKVFITVVVLTIILGIVWIILPKEK
jgi:hypothetical protein